MSSLPMFRFAEQCRQIMTANGIAPTPPRELKRRKKRKASVEAERKVEAVLAAIIHADKPQTIDALAKRLGYTKSQLYAPVKLLASEGRIKKVVETCRIGGYQRWILTAVSDESRSV